MTGTVVFSLDFELGWGHADIRPEYVRKLRDASTEEFDQVRELIDLFDKYDLPATWATVGKLTESGDDPLFHNPDLFQYLLDADVEHDVGLHSHEHQPFPALSESEARADLQSGVDALQRWNIQPRSFVYPRGLIDHTRLLSEYGLESYRSKQPDSRFTALKRLIRPPVANYTIQTTGGEPVSVPGTMFLAARRPLWHRKWVVRRALKRAAADDGFVHLWWHPHNVISQPAMLELLAGIFDQVRELRESDDLGCQPMAALVE